MEEGASVIFCSTLDAAITFGTSIFISSSMGTLVRSSSFGFGFSCAEAVMNAKETVTTWSTPQMNQEQGIPPAALRWPARLSLNMLAVRQSGWQGDGKPF